MLKCLWGRNSLVLHHIGDGAARIKSLLRMKQKSDGVFAFLCTLLHDEAVSHPFQVADAAAADGLHQLIVGGSHRRWWPAALLPSSVHRHRSQCVLELLEDAARLLCSGFLWFSLLAFLTLRLRCLLAACLVRPDDLCDHPCWLLLTLREWAWGRRWGRWWRRWWRSRGSLFFGDVTSGEFGRGPRRRVGWWPRRISFLEKKKTKLSVIALTPNVVAFTETHH